MHRGTPSSSALKAIAISASLMSFAFCVQGLFTNYELFLATFGGIDVFLVLYGIGVVAAIITLTGITVNNSILEYGGLVFSTWLYTLIGIFTLVVSYLHSPFIVVCLGVAVINGILAAYVKEGRNEKSFSSRPERAD